MGKMPLKSWKSAEIISNPMLSSHLDAAFANASYAPLHGDEHGRITDAETIHRLSRDYREVALMTYETTAVKTHRRTQALKAYVDHSPESYSDSFHGRNPLDADRSSAFRMRDRTSTEPLQSPERTPATTVIVADSNRAVAELLAESLSHHTWVRGTRICDTVAETLQWIDGETAPLIVSEISFRDQTGVHLAQEVRRLCPSARIAIWANKVSDVLLDRLIQIPVQGCFLKQDSLASLHAGLSVIVQGKSHFTPSVLERFVDGVARPGAVRGVAALRNFSPRHLNVLVRLAEGDSVKAIANALGVSVKTIDCLKYRMMKQLHLHDRVELARWAICEGLITA